MSSAMADTNTTKERPKVGVGVFVTSKDHPNCVLVGIRKNSSGRGKYALPGGHLEFGEEWVECGSRETLEETGLRLKNMRYATVVNCIVKSENYHYVTLFVQGEVDGSFLKEPVNQEPDKCEGWVWMDWDKFVPAGQCFRPLEVVIRQGYHPFRPSIPNQHGL